MNKKNPIDHQDLPREWRMNKNHPIHNVIGDISKGVTTRHSLNKVYNFVAFVLQTEVKGIDDAIVDEHWSLDMQDELNQLE